MKTTRDIEKAAVSSVSVAQNDAGQCTKTLRSSTLHTNTERELVTRMLNKDEAAFFSFVRTHEKALFNFIMRQLHDEHVAQELVQDVFIDFLEALRNFQFGSSLKTFLFSVAKFKIIDVIRKKKVKKILFSSMPDYVVDNLAPVFLEDEVEQHELAGRISSIIASLPHDYQTILRLKYMDGVRVKEISERLALPFKATESLLFRARKAFVKLFVHSV
jgi:RNA polymerase sigma-70 factor, ECF subfamily